MPFFRRWTVYFKSNWKTQDLKKTVLDPSKLWPLVPKRILSQIWDKIAYNPSHCAYSAFCRLKLSVLVWVPGLTGTLATGNWQLANWHKAKPCVIDRKWRKILSWLFQSPDKNYELKKYLRKMTHSNILHKCQSENWNDYK